MKDPSSEPRAPLADPAEGDFLDRLHARRKFIQRAAAGTLITTLGGVYAFADDFMGTADAKDRLPPGQRRLTKLKSMGGIEGDPSPGAFRLKVHGEVEQPFELDFQQLLAMPQVELKLDVHCVTGWSVFDALWKGVKFTDLAARATLKPSARHVIFEAANGYTTNVPLNDAMQPNVLVAHRLDDAPLGRAHGAPVRDVVPQLYFWKSAKWLTGIRFVTRDEPGYWEKRGYHNHADPWLEERYG